ncbi:hypothetical protein AAKU64_000738 [Undibacterium sp. GrIS 1.8]
MGEAKQRKMSESNFGRVPKKATHRGLVVSPPIEIDGSRMFVKSSNLDPQELRFALLFWDRLVWPSSRGIYFASNADEIFLETVGILSRPDYTINGDQAQAIAKGQILAYQDLERAEPGVWALAKGENSLLLKDGIAEEGKGALLELHRAIPIPRQDVPLAEILEFKQRRRDELNLLRYQLESFVSKIEESVDKPTELNKSISELDQACANLLAVGREWQYPVYLSNIKASFSLSPQKFLPALAGGWKFGEQYGLVTAAAVAGFAGIASTLEIKADYGLRSIKRSANPYRYAYLIHQELN